MVWVKVSHSVYIELVLVGKMGINHLKKQIGNCFKEILEGFIVAAMKMLKIGSYRRLQ